MKWKLLYVDLLQSTYWQAMSEHCYIKVILCEIDVNFTYLCHKMTCFCSAIVHRFTLIYANGSTYELTESICVKIDNLTNNQPSYFGLFGETTHRSHFDKPVPISM